MITHSEPSYNPMGNPNCGGNPSNPTNPSLLEDMLREMMRDMHARFDVMDNELKDLRTETNRRLNNL